MGTNNSWITIKFVGVLKPFQKFIILDAESLKEVEDNEGCYFIINEVEIYGNFMEVEPWAGALMKISKRNTMDVSEEKRLKI